jgi:hypothetical protein
MKVTSEQEIGKTTINRFGMSVVSVVEKEISTSQIMDMIITAMEGGSNYWYLLTVPYQPTKWEKQINDNTLCIKVYDIEEHHDALLEGEDVEPLGVLTRLSIKSGIEKMISDWPNAFQRWMDESYDAGDADIFFQLCCMGEVVYA